MIKRPFYYFPTQVFKSVFQYFILINFFAYKVYFQDWIKFLWDIYTMEYYSAIKKEENSTFCNIMDGPGEHYAE